MLANNYAYKYETPYNGSFLITWCWNNGTVKKHSMVQQKLGIIYVGLSHIHLIQTLKILTLKIYVAMSTNDHQLYTSVFILNL